MDIWETIRIRCVRDKEPIKRVARELGISKNTVKKYIESSTAPVVQSTIQKTSSMAVFESEIDRLLHETPKITAVRIGQIIRAANPAFDLREAAIRRYVASRRARIIPKEAFVRLVYDPGDQMQLDFKDVVAIISGIETKLFMFVARLSYSTAFFTRCYLSEDRPALFDGILASCVYFGGIVREAIFDNATTAVKRVLLGRTRELNPAFAAFCGSLALKMEFAAPAKGNEKGGVEGLHGYIEDHVFRPMPEYASLNELNAALNAFSAQHLQKRISGEFVHERLERERVMLRTLPVVLPSTCIRDAVRINKFSEVTYKTNRYSVPSRYAHHNAILEIFHDRLRIIVDTELVAEHQRIFGHREAALDPLHFIDLLSHKHRAVVRAEVFRQRGFDQSLRALLDAYSEYDPASAGKRFMRVIALLEQFSMHDLATAAATAVRRGTTDPAAIELLLQQQHHPYQEISPLPINPGAQGSSRPIASLDSYNLSSLKEYV